MQRPHQAGHHPQYLGKKSRAAPQKASKITQNKSQQELCNYLSLNAFSQLEVVPSSASPSCFSSLALPHRLGPDYSTSEQAWSTGFQSPAVCSAPLQCQEAALLPFALYHEALWG